ncbi:Protein of unknown function [Flavobacterium akiainvivens]|nr:Protein of unknown function [Flavobacterium akiainvivens]
MLAENFDAAIPLKLNNFPGSFYKYRALSERTIDILEKNYIWLAEIASLNDPFECSIQFDNNECLRKYYGSQDFHDLFVQMTDKALSSAEIRLLTKSQKPYEEYIKICAAKNIPLKLSPEQQLSKVQDRWSEIISETNRKLRICSFSLNNDSLLLWSHYAEEHKGICIEYDLLDNDIARAYIQPVIYSSKVPKIGIFEDYNTIQMVASSLIKSKEWEYEQEWRITIFKQSENFPQKLQVPKPVAIYLGTRFEANNEELKEKLYQFAAMNNIPLYPMKKHPQEFRLIRG